MIDYEELILERQDLQEICEDDLDMIDDMYLSWWDEMPEDAYDIVFR